MNNIQETLLFPFRDRDAWNQFLIACAVMLASFFIPILPSILLLGYATQIMRQVILEKRAPSMPKWQGSDWGEMFMDGLKLYGAQLVFMLPFLLFFGCGIIFILSGSIGFTALAEESTRSFTPIAMVLLFFGVGITMVASLLAIPLGVVTSAAAGHVAAKRSFQAAFEFKEWWSIFRAAIGPFLLAYAIMMVTSFIFTFVIQIAMITLVLMCIVPFLMMPYMAYLLIISNVLYAQAYAKGQEALQTA